MTGPLAMRWIGGRVYVDALNIAELLLDAADVFAGQSQAEYDRALRFLAVAFANAEANTEPAARSWPDRMPTRDDIDGGAA